MRLRSTLALCVLLGALFLSQAAAAADQIPAARRAMIMGRMLAYDGNLKSRAGDKVVLAVIFKPGHAASEAEANEMFAAFKALEQVKMADLPFKVVRLPFGGSAGLESKVTELGVDALYICAGLEGDVDKLSAVGRDKKALTVTAQVSNVRSGLSVAVYWKDEKTAILINLPASKAEGAAFGGDVLRLAEVIR